MAWSVSEWFVVDGDPVDGVLDVVVGGQGVDPDGVDAGVAEEFGDQDEVGAVKARTRVPGPGSRRRHVRMGAVGMARATRATARRSASRPGG
ncbi:hypothetical protein UK99_20295, partial [Frankia casuarinae]|uniref:hypothetical protein n=1 Tax=Frankia casuarinae (strain DSM 45818 / CECT 9043 / HFP020203 / CcI3) TaxID=106370 RepID=UPI000A21BE3D